MVSFTRSLEVEVTLDRECELGTTVGEVGNGTYVHIVSPVAGLYTGILGDMNQFHQKGTLISDLTLQSQKKV